jgi:hypothetical protein
MTERKKVNLLKLFKKMENNEQIMNQYHGLLATITRLLTYKMKLG